MTTTYDFTFLDDADPVAANTEQHILAAHRTLSFLRLWRRHACTSGTITRHYHHTHNAITIHSASSKYVRIVVTNDNGSTHYDFSEMDDVVSGVYTNARGKHTVLTDFFELHDILARMLLECRNYDLQHSRQTT